MENLPPHLRSRVVFKRAKSCDQLLGSHLGEGSVLKSLLCWAALGAGALAFVLAAYGVAVVAQARRATPAIIKNALAPEYIKLELSALSRRQLDQLLKVEDPQFVNHKGVDLKTPGAGLTTITQALVKLFYFKDFKPGFAKFKQTLVARYAVHPLVPKQDQLKLFINYAYLGRCKGEPVRGFSAAAGCYYNKPFARLKEDEYLALVAMLAAPDTFSLVANPQANKDRVARIKKVISGEYVPVDLMDIYYGPLDPYTQTALAPASYFPSLYEN
jgi:membrane carboxypeptidase/penicillin-binding protein